MYDWAKFFSGHRVWPNNDNGTPNVRLGPEGWPGPGVAEYGTARTAGWTRSKHLVDRLRQASTTARVHDLGRGNNSNA